jgi:hypothetical protein
MREGMDFDKMREPILRFWKCLVQDQNIKAETLRK